MWRIEYEPDESLLIIQLTKQVTPPEMNELGRVHARALEATGGEEWIAGLYFWNWLAAHPNCILRAGTPEAVLYDDEEFHWHFAAEGGGTLRAAYAGELTAEEGQAMIELMLQNHEAVLLEGGLPPGARLAHKHGYVADTHADAAIVFKVGSERYRVPVVPASAGS